MSKKTALVSGASGNLGKGVVQHFLKKGYRVVGMVHHKGSETDESENYHEIEANLTDENAAEDSVSKVIQELGQIDVAVLTAGGFAMGNLEKTKMKNLKQQYSLNFETAFNVAQPVFLQMKKQESGKLFFIGSEPGMDTRKAKNTVAYSLSKSLLFQLTNIINAESKESGVNAFTVVPSTIDTPPNRESMPGADYSKWETPEEIAGVIDKYVESSIHPEGDRFIVVQSEL